MLLSSYCTLYTDISNNRICTVRLFDFLKKVFPSLSYQRPACLLVFIFEDPHLGVKNYFIKLKQRDFQRSAIQNDYFEKKLLQNVIAPFNKLLLTPSNWSIIYSTINV